MTHSTKIAMKFDAQQPRRFLITGLLGATLVLGVGESLAPRTQVQANETTPGQASVVGRDGQYSGQILVEAPAEMAWQVLTDYDNFKNFLPNVAESKVVSSQGNQKVFEQVNEFRVLAFTKKARVRLASTETYPKQVAFKVVDGDVKELQGTWTLSSPAPNQVLIRHEVSVMPKDSDNKTLFFGIYKSSLKRTIAAVGREVERRSQ